LLGIFGICLSAARSISVYFGHTHGTVALSDELEELFVMLLMAEVAIVILAAASLH
jgi:hypothetical protein